MNSDNVRPFSFKSVGEVLKEFDRFTKIYVSEDFCECLVNSSQLTPSPFIFSVIAVAVPPVFPSVFRIQNEEHLDAKNLLILLHFPLRVLHLRENVNSYLRNLSAKICHPI